MITAKEADTYIKLAEQAKKAGDSYAIYVFDRYSSQIDRVKDMIKDGIIDHTEAPHVTMIVNVLEQVCKRAHL